MPCILRAKLSISYLWLALVFTSCLFTAISASAQTQHIDSLQNRLKTSIDDTNKVNTLNAIGKIFWQKRNYKKAAVYAMQAKTLAENLNFKKGASNAYSILGLTYTEDAKYDEALKSYKQALNLRELTGDKKAIAASYNNIGVVHIFEDKLDSALKNHLQALKIGQEINDKMSMATAYSNMGVVYAAQGNYDEALKCHLEAVRLRQEMAREGKIELDNYDIQTAFHDLPKDDKQHSVHTQATTGNQESVVELYLNIAKILVKQKKFVEAKVYLDKALKAAKESNDVLLVLESYKGLAELAAMGGNFQNAYEYYKEYNGLKDLVRTSEDSSYTAITTYNCELEKTQIKEEMQYELNKAKSTIRWLIACSVSVILLLVIMFVITNYRLYLQKQQAKQDLYMKNKQE